ncbi:hypothetical protein AVEN_205356-1 [Araneus ventricosus]|uniref:Uncharacterized protein n=1 Tax=Araneus ventricosus TaxID=182803 RepID=A0A4Y2VFD3_ARAVE|nr:hypothetical protein AVEN_205356-1 [Araneus ventricosus]
MPLPTTLPSQFTHLRTILLNYYPIVDVGKVLGTIQYKKVETCPVAFVCIHKVFSNEEESIGAEGRKRQKIDAEESEKVSKFMKTFFVRPRKSNSPDFKKSPNAASLLGSKNDTQGKEEIISEAEQQGYDDDHLKIIKKKAGDLFKVEDDNLNDKSLSVDKETDIAKQKERIAKGY